MAYEKLKDENYRNLGGINVKLSQYTTQETQFLNLRNYTFVRPGALTSRPGVEANYSLPVSQYPIPPVNNIEYTKNDGSSFQLFDSGSTLYTRGNNAVAQSLIPGTSGLPLDYVIQNDYLYYANGYAFYRFDGTYTIQWNTVAQLSDFTSGNITFSTSLIPVNGVTAVIPSGDHYFFLGGFRNAPSLYTAIMSDTFNTNSPPDGEGILKTLGSTIVGQGRWLMYGFTLTTNDRGVSAGIAYYSNPLLRTVDSVGNILNAQGSTALLFGRTVIAGVTQWFFEFDHFTTGIDYRLQSYLGLQPKYLQTFNNMLFMGNMVGVSAIAGGVTPAPSTVWFSNVGRPEEVDEQNFVEVRTGNGDFITGMEVFQDSLLIFKQNSAHELTGSSPETLSLRDINLEYGCLNNRGIATFENRLWFIDRKGIVEYNGANFEVVSEPVELYLDQADKAKMTALHVKSLNQVWFASSNKVFAYDYLIKAWTIYDNLRIDDNAGAQVLSYGATIKEVTYWQSGASFHQGVKFNASLYTDFGAGITLLFQTRFHKRLGDSTQELWRRLYINADTPGTTQGVTVNFKPDYGTSTFMARSMPISSFQQRIDFGISAKSLSAEVIMQASQQIRVNGYAVESRYLRSV